MNFREKGLSGVLDVLEVMAARVDPLKTDLEAKIDQLEEENTELTINQVEKIPECLVNIKLHFTLSDKFPQCFISQVCLVQFQKDRPIYGCPVGHHICDSCKPSIQVREWSPGQFYLNLHVQVCPSCQRPIGGRNHDYENLISELWG